MTNRIPWNGDYPMTWTHIDLCCGLGGWQEPFQDNREWRSIGIDVREDLSPDVVGDVRELPLTRCEPTLVTASPPCTEFSTANKYRTTDGTYHPDTSVWEGCRSAIHHLKPTYWVIENVAGAQHWFGQSHWSRHPWHLWGHFPPMDTGPLPAKDTWLQCPEDTAKIPFPLANALRKAVEWSL